MYKYSFDKDATISSMDNIKNSIEKIERKFGNLNIRKNCLC